MVGTPMINWYRRMLFFLVYMVEHIISIVTFSYFPMLFTNLGLDPRVYGVVGSLSLILLVVKFLTMAMIYLIVAIICALRILPLARIKMKDVEKTVYQQEGE